MTAAAIRRPDSFANLQNHFMSLNDTTSLSAKYNHLISPTSTLSSGYESGCIESEIDDMLYSGSLSSHQNVQAQDECEYFELESDQYVCLGGQCTESDDTDDKLMKVRDSMIKIIADLESLGYETSLDELSKAVRSSVRTNKKCSKSEQSSIRRSSRKSSSSKTDYSQNTNNNCVYTKSQVDELFTEMGQHQDRCRKEKLYDSLITNLAIECNSTSQDYLDEPIYEEIHDDSDFDFVSHSDTYRKHSGPPALPPRTNSLELSRKSKHIDSHRRTSSPCLTEVQKVAWNSGHRKSSSWHTMSV